MGKLKNTSAQSLRLALLHYAPRYDHIPQNVALLERLFLKAVELQTDLILTPELAVSGYEFYKVLGAEWIKTDVLRIIEKFRSLCRANKVAMLLGSPTYDPQDGKYRNAAVFIDEQGQVIGEHHKILVLPGGTEGWSSPGEVLRPVAWRSQKIGLLICADAYQASLAAELAQQGADVLISLAAWAPGEHGPNGEWEQSSKDTGLSFVVCNRTGQGPVLNFEGSSSIVAVAGRRMVEYSEKRPAILTIDVDAHTWHPHSDQFSIYESDENETT